MSDTNKRNRFIYIVLTYILFVVFIGIIGLTMMVFELKVLSEVLIKISAWTPTIVLLVMFRRLYPGDKIKTFLARQFQMRPDARSITLSIGLPLCIFWGTLLFQIVYTGQPLKNIIITSPASLLIAIPLHLLAGPLGEQLGWRAYLLNSFLKKHSTLKAGFIVGLIWGFWHWPLWLISGYQGVRLLIYILAFMTAIVCCSIIITILYMRSKNLLIPITVHFLNNYLLGLFSGDILKILCVYAACYAVVTFILIGMSQNDKNTAKIK